MSFGSPVFVLAIVAIALLAGIIKTMIRARHGYPLDDHRGRARVRRGDQHDERAIALLADENEKLKAMICRLEERVAVLERIVTDSSTALDRQIEALRDRADLR